MVRMSKGSQCARSLNTDRLNHSVQQPIVRMDFVPLVQRCVSEAQPSQCNKSGNAWRVCPVGKRPFALPPVSLWRGVPLQNFSHFFLKNKGALMQEAFLIPDNRTGLEKELHDWVKTKLRQGHSLHSVTRTLIIESQKLHDTADVVTAIDDHKKLP